MMFRLSILICFTLLQFNLHAQKTQTSIEKGKASFYADKFEGKRTSCGERYHHKNYTAAHRSLPFGTWVKVVNMDNKKAVIVRITDRGPFIKGRIIDLSKSAIKEIGNINQGVFSVSVEVYQKDLDMIPIQYIFNPIPEKEQMQFGF
ncbi:hypothetical protein BZG01_10000 [Labilibaculum manganireducens]|uniref:Probable endolytic peptidoglycan transglycosylase RlpA n=1 Tax=Labilibaculum manganireducens TaxID=1940525 RepID=A0A2N3I8I5_9BACT|nr:septal ring lytic transglycosylase RlpA family protein [Labilibaculum manganireducens]PKQ66605.1 hypothetical protein BZG01_10000 [Labilibaculum manganireducens]